MDIDDSKRFEAELEFVQSLASPDYLNWLGQNKYFEDESFVKFLAYLQYWKRPEYAKFIVYPHCLFFLELLQEADFRKAIANPQFKEVVHEQQYYTFIHWRKNRRHAHEQQQ
eukprot:jgi/Picre1/34382/NNA_001852.t1